MSTAIHVGASPEASKDVFKQLLSILNSGADQRNIQVALEILNKVSKSPDYTTINNCSFTMETKSE